MDKESSPNIIINIGAGGYPKSPGCGALILETIAFIIFVVGVIVILGVLQ